MCPPRWKVCRGCGEGDPTPLGEHWVHHSAPDGRHWVHQCAGWPCSEDTLDHTVPDRFGGGTALDWPALQLPGASDAGCFHCHVKPRIVQELGEAVYEVVRQNRDTLTVV